MNLLKIHVASGTVVRAFTHYSSNDAALDALYDYMSSCISNNSITKATAELIDDDGIVSKIETWSKN